MGIWLLLLCVDVRSSLLCFRWSFWRASAHGKMRGFGVALRRQFTTLSSNTAAFAPFIHLWRKSSAQLKHVQFMRLTFSWNANYVTLLKAICICSFNILQSSSKHEAGIQCKRSECMYSSWLQYSTSNSQGPSTMRATFAGLSHTQGESDSFQKKANQKQRPKQQLKI